MCNIFNGQKLMITIGLLLGTLTRIHSFISQPAKSEYSFITPYQSASQHHHLYNKPTVTHQPPYYANPSDVSDFQIPKNYAFSYAIRDGKSGDDYSHSEAHNGEATKGEYRVKLPDGRMQIVTYTADENGYKADIRYDNNYSSSEDQSIGLSQIPIATVYEELPKKITKESIPLNAIHHRNKLQFRKFPEFKSNSNERIFAPLKYKNGNSFNDARFSQIKPVKEVRFTPIFRKPIIGSYETMEKFEEGVSGGMEIPYTKKLVSDVNLLLKYVKPKIHEESIPDNVRFIPVRDDSSENNNFIFPNKPPIVAPATTTEKQFFNKNQPPLSKPQPSKFIHYHRYHPTKGEIITTKAVDSNEIFDQNIFSNFDTKNKFNSSQPVSYLAQSVRSPQLQSEFQSSRYLDASKSASLAPSELSRPGRLEPPFFNRSGIHASSHPISPQYSSKEIYDTRGNRNLNTVPTRESGSWYITTPSSRESEFKYMNLNSPKEPESRYISPLRESKSRYTTPSGQLEASHSLRESESRYTIPPKDTESRYTTSTPYTSESLSTEASAASYESNSDHENDDGPLISLSDLDARKLSGYFDFVPSNEETDDQSSSSKEHSNSNNLQNSGEQHSSNPSYTPTPGNNNPSQFYDSYSPPNPNKQQSTSNGETTLPYYYYEFSTATPSYRYVDPLAKINLPPEYNNLNSGESQEEQNAMNNNTFRLSSFLRPLHRERVYIHHNSQPITEQFNHFQPPTTLNPLKSTPPPPPPSHRRKQKSEDVEFTIVKSISSTIPPELINEFDNQLPSSSNVVPSVVTTPTSLPATNSTKTIHEQSWQHNRKHRSSDDDDDGKQSFNNIDKNIIEKIRSTLATRGNVYLRNLDHDKRIK